MAEWMPATAEDVGRILAEQLADCTQPQQELFDRIKAPLRSYPIARFDSIEQVFGIGLSRGRVLFWEDVEEGFVLARPDADGVIRDYDTSQFELKHVLEQLLRSEAS